jgi:hypothetical protein
MAGNKEIHLIADAFSLRAAAGVAWALVEKLHFFSSEQSRLCRKHCSELRLACFHDRAF